MRQFGWQLSVAINTVTLGLLVILFIIIIFLFLDVALYDVINNAATIVSQARLLTI